MKMRLRKVSAVIMILALTLCATTGCGTTQEASDQKLLRVGMECAYAPFNWTQETTVLSNGEEAVPIFGTDDYAYGYDVMMAIKLAEEMGYDGVEIHRSEWDSLGLGLEGNEFDCIIAGMSKTPERELIYDFTDTYYIRKTVITVPADSEYASFTKLDDFKGVGGIVTTQLGTTWVSMLEQVPDTELGANYATTAECFMAVANGVADMTVIDQPTSESALLTNPDLVMLTLDEGGFEDTSTNICISTTKGNDELVSEINAALASLEWDKAKMDEMMSLAIELQPANN